MREQFDAILAKDPKKFPYVKISDKDMQQYGQNCIQAKVTPKPDEFQKDYLYGQLKPEQMKKEFTLGKTNLKYSFFPTLVDGNELRYMDGFDEAFTTRHLWHYAVHSYFTEGAYTLSLNPGHLNEFSFHMHIAKDMK